MGKNKNATATAKEPKERSLVFKTKMAFIAIATDLENFGEVSEENQATAKELLASYPVTQMRGLPASIQLTQVDEKLSQIYESGNVDENELRTLLNKKARLQKEVDVSNEAEVEA